LKVSAAVCVGMGRKRWAKQLNEICVFECAHMCCRHADVIVIVVNGKGLLAVVGLLATVNRLPVPICICNELRR
jgi:hypothetical protein